MKLKKLFVYNCIVALISSFAQGSTIQIDATQIEIIDNRISETDANRIIEYAKERYFAREYQKAANLVSAIELYGQQTAQFDDALLLKSKITFMWSKEPQPKNENVTIEKPLFKIAVQKQLGYYLREEAVISLQKISSLCPNGDVIKSDEFKRTICTMLEECMSSQTCNWEASFSHLNQSVSGPKCDVWSTVQLMFLIKKHFPKVENYRKDYEKFLEAKVTWSNEEIPINGNLLRITDDASDLRIGIFVERHITTVQGSTEKNEDSKVADDTLQAFTVRKPWKYPRNTNYGTWEGSATIRQLYKGIHGIDPLEFETQDPLFYKQKEQKKEIDPMEKFMGKWNSEDNGSWIVVERDRTATWQGSNLSGGFRKAGWENNQFDGSGHLEDGKLIMSVTWRLWSNSRYGGNCQQVISWKVVFELGENNTLVGKSKLISDAMGREGTCTMVGASDRGFEFKR